MNEFSWRSWTRLDVAALSLLLISGLLIAWPVFAGVARTYLDNPCHLAELRSLASPEGPSGWSRIAMCGFPIGMLHSPLWYGLLAWLAKLGFDPETLLGLGLTAGFLLPPVALFLTARGRLGPLAAFVFAWLFLARRPAVVGVGSILGGMWTWGIALGLFVALLISLSRSLKTVGDLLIAGGLIGILLLTHVYTVVPIAALLIASMFVPGRGAGERARLLWAGLLGALLSVRIWAPLLLSGESLVRTSQNLDPMGLLQLLVLPVDAVEVIRGTASWSGGILSLEGLGICFIVTLGLIGASTGRSSVDGFSDKRMAASQAVSRLGLGIALILLVALAGPIQFFDLTWFGPNSWRILEFVRLGLFLAAIAGVERLNKSIASRDRGILARACGMILLLGLTIGSWQVGAELRGQVLPPADPECLAVEKTWEWLQSNRAGIPGRVYVQDTFGTPPLAGRLANSHLMALTGSEAGLESLGSYYGIVPFPAGMLTMSEFGRPFRRSFTRNEEIPLLATLLQRFGCSHLVTAEPALAGLVGRSALFRSCFSADRFSIWELNSGGVDRVESVIGTSGVFLREVSPGRLVIDIEAAAPGGALLIKEAFHSFWEAWWVAPEGKKPLVIMGTDDGLMVVPGLGSGAARIELLFHPPAWPFQVTWLGWLLMGIAAGSFVRWNRA